MASIFPQGIDGFVNPQYTKVNGIDLVKAEHVNDLQDAVRNLQLSFIGAGLNIGFTSNNYVPQNANLKNAIEILDTSIFNIESMLETHENSNLPTDPAVHHANVIQVSPIGNLSSTRVQAALEEHQIDINNIMSGGLVEGSSLDNRYVTKAGNSSITGSLSISEDLEVNRNITLESPTGVLEAKGSTLLNTLEVNGESLFKSNIKIDQGFSLRQSDTVSNSLSFLPTGLEIKSINNIDLFLDHDDFIDGQNDLSEFRIFSGISELLSLNKDGSLSILNDISVPLLVTETLMLGSSSLFEEDEINTRLPSFSIKLDTEGEYASQDFRVVKDGETGDLNTSIGIILKATDTELISGNHILKRGIQETGYFGLKFYSENAGGRFNGVGINFKAVMLNTPSSIILNVDPSSSNYDNLSITHITPYGFFIECDSMTTGEVVVRGTYQTVGN